MAGPPRGAPRPSAPVGGGVPRTHRSDPPGLAVQLAPTQRNAGLGFTGRDVGDPASAGAITAAEHFRWTVAAAGYGVESRSRFGSPVDVDEAALGHGATIQIRPVVPPRDPAAGRTSFPPQHYAGEDYHPEPSGDRSRRELSLGEDTIALLRGGELVQHSHDAPGAGVGRRLAPPFSWADSGPWSQGIRWLYSHVRREYNQGAQTFRGGGGERHTRVRPGGPYARQAAKYSQFPRRMAAPRVFRLTERAAPPSYGSSTELLGPSGDVDYGAAGKGRRGLPGEPRAAAEVGATVGGGAVPRAALGRRARRVI